MFRNKFFSLLSLSLLLALSFLLLILLEFSSGQTALDHQVTYLPGFNGAIKFKSYTGYLKANATRGHYLFYWFMESQNNPATDPVVWWTNGGPGE